MSHEAVTTWEVFIKVLEGKMKLSKITRRH